ncbi:MAG: type II toxin-antitoxin system VapC family toxin [Bacteroidales bacterium]|jgi:tRNA(fMet)-specific endonuclease VapC|nr:type II toxin-antitoxin system VapC family toxin [Bacteroidales bacterium]NCU35002.1 type II toxin-antitoxin system VapC family toxin [Candidatus Falkowbacteria bacterium]MDD2632808.1 type II toxin-antitoxin system VapC family toxin [Bacteroidales bacterium]MDD3132817.1 type II toxin-antitoxin system VapC family toxin [Bacteroidales bacterium]MDD3525660.1 type II toxin-antitoxin system VapC family toxin [Bacteroidales bacterium]
MKRAMIDTDILSYFFDSIEICLLAHYEITSGLRARQAITQLSAFERFVDENKVILLTEKSSEISAELYATLRREGKPLDGIDLLIAGVAIENEMVLVTNNEKHFGRTPNLKIENWTL